MENSSALKRPPVREILSGETLNATAPGIPELASLVSGYSEVWFEIAEDLERELDKFIRLYHTVETVYTHKFTFSYEDVVRALALALDSLGREPRLYDTDSGAVIETSIPRSFWYLLIGINNGRMKIDITCLRPSLIEVRFTSVVRKLTGKNIYQWFFRQDAGRGRRAAVRIKSLADQCLCRRQKPKRSWWLRFWDKYGKRIRQARGDLVK